jgi:two-component system, cell cycle response regulator
VTGTKSKQLPFASDGGVTLQIDRKDLGLRSPGAVQHHFILVCVEGHEVGKPTELVLAETVVGRAPNCGLMLADSKVSRQHAKILWMDGYHLVEDLNSANGTFVGGNRVTRKRLSPGDVIQFGTAFAFRYSVMDSTQKALLEQLYQSSVIDALTGAFNREYFNAVLGAELAHLQPTSPELSLLMLDIDHFKRVNDEHGHQAGDAVLIELVSRIRLRLRHSDVLCRFGGEEFAIILRATTLANAARMAERLRQAVRKHKIQYAEKALSVTVSIGCASIACCEQKTPDTLVAVADRRLYAAKHGGRDCVVVSD